jgi:OmpA-OmpF porin, OOP family
MQHRKTSLALALLCAALALAGCSGWSSSPPMRGNPLVEPLNLPAVQSRAQQGGGATFTQALTNEYASLATDLSSNAGDWADADYFSRKGLAASRGEVVVPEQNSNWLVPLEVPLKTRDELTVGRQKLVAALDGGARERSPAVAARAQRSYDCWVERMEDDWKSAVDGPCHKAFVDALCELDRSTCVGVAQAAPAAPPPVPTRQYNVYFDFDKSNLTPEAQQIVNQVASQAKANNARVVLVGKADLSGTDAYNIALSKRRADAVRAALAADGVSADRIDEQWVGMRQPPVPTAPGVREPRNRVVEVSFH